MLAGQFIIGGRSLGVSVVNIWVEKFYAFQVIHDPRCVVAKESIAESISAKETSPKSDSIQEHEAGFSRVNFLER